MSKRRGKGEGTLFKRTRKRKDGSSYVMWAGEVTVGYGPSGEQKRKTVYGKTQREALEKMSEVRGCVSAGTFSSDRTTVGAYLAHWLDYKKLEVKSRTQAYYSDYIRLYLEPELGRIELSKLTPLHIQEGMKSVAEVVSTDAANKSRTVLRMALERAVRLGLLPRNPVDSVDKLKHEPREIKLWTPEQVHTFLCAAKGHRLFAAFFLALSTGMRHGEILGVRWQDVDGDVITIRQSVITVRGAQFEISAPKTRKGIRRVVIDHDTKRILQEHETRQEAQRRHLGECWDDHGLVFTNELGGVIVPRNLDREWYALQRQAGLPRIRFHDLRHLHVSLLIRRGFDPRTVADRVGHTDPAFTLRQYSHMFEAQRREAAIPLKQLLGRERQGSPDE
ncbi:MAG: site-specific integrase [Trueperaceae bacterium]